MLAQQGSCWYDKKLNALDFTLPTDDGSGTLFATTHRLFVFPKIPRASIHNPAKPWKVHGIKKRKRQLLEIGLGVPFLVKK